MNDLSFPMSEETAVAAYGEAFLIKVAYLQCPPDYRARMVFALRQAGVSATELRETLGISFPTIRKQTLAGAELSGSDPNALINVIQHKDRDERFWDYVFPEPNSGCWIYAGGDNGHGYGSFMTRRGRKYAHRFAYEAIKGPIPKGMELDHLCCLRCCCNPDHLEPVTRQENIRRSVARGAVFRAPTTHCPKGHPKVDGNVVEIKRADGRTYRACRQCQQEASRRREAKRVRIR